MTLVAISSDLYGVSFGVVESANAGGICVAMTYWPPAGTALLVHFRHIYHHDVFGEVVDHLCVQCEVEARRPSKGGLQVVRLRFVELVADPPDDVSYLRMQ